MTASTLGRSTQRGASSIALGYSAGMQVLAIMNGFTLSASPSIQMHVSAIHGFAVILLSFLALVYLLRCDRAALLSPLSYVLLVTIAFHGVGVLYYTYGSEASLAWSNNIYPVTSESLTKVDLVSSVGLAAVWLAASVVLGVRSGMRRNAIPPVVPADWLARFYFVVGFGAWYLLVIPYTLGWTPFTLPGVGMLLVNLAYASVFLMSVLRQRTQGRQFRLLLPIGVFAGIFAGLLTTSKTYAILTLLFYFLGRFHGRRDIRKLLTGMLTLLILYVVLAPFVLFVRDQLVRQPERVAASIWVDYFESQGEASTNTGVQWAFLRLSYVGPEAYCVDQYDSGVRTKSLSSGFVDVLVPRLIFPDKPVRNLGRDFSEEYNSNPNNSISPGIFAEAYWGGGWIALIGIGLLAGLALGFAHRFIGRALMEEDWLVLPLVVGLFLGLGLINGFATDVLVYFPVVLVALQVGVCGVVALVAPRCVPVNQREPVAV